MKNCFFLLLFTSLFAIQSNAQDSLATVYFYKPGKASKSFEPYVVFDGDQAIGRVKAGKLFAYRCKPGVRTFTASTATGTNSIGITLEADVWYFVKCDLAEGKPSFQKVVGDEAENDIFKINEAISKEIPSHRYTTRMQPFTPNDSLAIIYFYRTANVGGFLIAYDVKHNANPIGKIAIKSVFGYRCPPGLQTFTAKTESESSITMDVKGGQLYFVKCGVAVGVMVGRPAFQQMSTEEGRRDVSNIDPSIAAGIPVIAESTTEQNDTLRALINLFQRKRRGGNTRAIVCGSVAAGLVISGLTYKPQTVSVGSQSFNVGSGSEGYYVLAGISAAIMVTGILQNGKYKSAREEKVISDYKDGKPLPKSIKQKLKAKDF